MATTAGAQLPLGDRVDRPDNDRAAHSNCDDEGARAPPICSTAADADVDAFPRSEACDDSGPSLRAHRLDAACDGRPAEEDWNDTEAELGGGLCDFDWDGAD